MRADESGKHLDLEKEALEVVEWGRAHDEAVAAPQAAGYVVGDGKGLGEGESLSAVESLKILGSRERCRGRQRGQAKIQADHSTKQELNLHLDMPRGAASEQSTSKGELAGVAVPCFSQAEDEQAVELQLQQLRPAEACVLHGCGLVRSTGGDCSRAASCSP